MGGKVSYELEKNVETDETEVEVIESNGFKSKTKITRNLSYRCGAGRESWGAGFKDPSFKSRGFGDIDKKEINLTIEIPPEAEGTAGRKGTFVRKEYVL
ncbi:uncharacterized protein LOC111697834 isoform X2 [Eurytemora carolleeae]|uniref:uncharacterized protein LOC111697834 isoform X2 n=1 Tax=Eurytemora carolleeae TaxID=1294199 RepID=UPI000C76F1F8|nr:uncharacterized protein LOC111697834 isoform X2 [Eurytemora carolleeae]|eukprot:XP_023323731.1 uncharacterized protein LOC111697834 isoform X2 [Eurytemora affinis]